MHFDQFTFFTVDLHDTCPDVAGTGKKWAACLPTILTRIGSMGDCSALSLME